MAGYLKNAAPFACVFLLALIHLFVFLRLSREETTRASSNRAKGETCIQYFGGRRLYHAVAPSSPGMPHPLIVSFALILFQSYRYFLWQMLKHFQQSYLNPVGLDFVGGMQGPNEPEYDADHEGHAGWTAESILK